MKRTFLTCLLSIILCAISLSAQTISSVFPDSTHQGQTVTVTITGAGVNFTSGTGASIVRLSGPGIINSSSVSVISPTDMTAQFNISPLAIPGIYNMQVLGYSSLAPGVFEITGVPPVSQYYYVTGQIYFDDNNDCMHQPTEIPIVQRPVKLGNRSTVTASDGTYGIWVNLGAYNVSFTPGIYEIYPCGATQLVSSSISGDTISGVDFPVDTATVRDIRVLASSPILRPGFTSFQYITVSNNGTIPFPGGQLFHKTNSVFSRKNTIPTPVSFVNDTTIWTIPAISPGQSLTFNVKDSLSVSTPLGSPVPRSAWLQYSPLDGDQQNDTVRIIRNVQGSYDPNDKRVYDEHAVEIERFVPPGDSILRYNVRFQNTGNDTAFNIFVRDTIDSQFDLGSIRTLASSHNYVFTMQDSAVQWFFPNIFLLDSFSNEPASHGFFEFEIKYNPAYPSGTTFHNNAAIYFDYNTPIITNETETVICDFITAGYTSSTSGLAASFTNTSPSSTSWEWDFGDGNISITQNPSHTYTFSGNYSVCLIATNSCGRSDTVCTLIQACGATAPANFTQSATGTTLSFIDQTAGNPVSWVWNFGDGNTSTAQNPSHTYAASGTYTVCLVMTDVCGNSNSTCQTITVCTSINAGFSTSATQLLASFFNTSGSSATGFFWDFGDGNTSTVQNPQHTYATSGNYTVCLIASNMCGNDTICQSITVNCPVVAAAFTSSASSLSATFSNTSAGSATGFLWDFGDGNTSNVLSPTHNYGASGTYTVCLIASNLCGNDTVCQTITVTCVAPVSAFTYTPGASGIDFTDLSNNSPTSWYWDFGDGSFLTIQNPQNHFFPGPGSYTVCLIASSPCGADTSCQTVVLTGLEDVELESFQIYPNPTSSSIFVEGSATKTVQLSILDMTGRLLKPTVSMDAPGAFKTQLDLNDLPNGIYFLEIRSGDAVSRHKIIKQ